jgi:thiosulfate/3-mercaptopyruvate sulfurtransferase
MDGLVTTEWLAAALDAGDLLVLDATYTSTLPGAAKQDPRAEFVEGHIPGAGFLDLDTLVDAQDPLPSMLPPRAVFEARMALLGAGGGKRIVLYDNSPHHTACRAWWVLRMYGVEAVLLDGGIAKWKAEGRPLESGTSSPEPGTFTAGSAKARARTLAEMKATSEQIVDARSLARFTGDEPDPRPDCGSGHIPGSKSLTYSRLFNPDRTWKPRDAIRAEFEAAGVDLDRPLVATCGSGITASVLVFAAHLLGHDAALYDGSWSEWGADPSTPKAMGPA